LQFSQTVRRNRGGRDSNLQRVLQLIQRSTANPPSKTITGIQKCMSHTITAARPPDLPEPSALRTNQLPSTEYYDWIVIPTTMKRRRRHLALIRSARLPHLL
jgi:hypothetical protein